MRKTASRHNERSNENDDGAALEARDLEGAAREVREFAPAARDRYRSFLRRRVRM